MNNNNNKKKNNKIEKYLEICNEIKTTERDYCYYLKQIIEEMKKNMFHKQ